MATYKKCLGVDLGTNTVKVVEVSADRTGVRVTKSATAETGVDPAAPPEERRAAIAKAARDLLKKARISTREAVFALPGQKVFIRRFRLPITTDERLERIVNYEARQQIPFPLDKTDLQWQFFPIPEDNEVEVLLVAVRHDEVSEFMALVNKTGLKPVAIAVSSFALFNANAFLARPAAAVMEELVTRGKKAKAPKKKKKGEEAEAPAEEPAEEAFVPEEVKGFVNIGASAMDLAIAQQGKKTLLKFCRSVPTAGNTVTRNIMDTCSVSSFLDAERIQKHQTKLMTFDFEFEGSDQINQEACSAATQAVDRIISELRRSLDFFISQPDGMAVDTLVLSGGAALLPGMDTYIEEKLTIPVSVVSELPEATALQWQREQGEALAPYLNAVGLALQGVHLGAINVDFLPTERKITRDFPYRTVAVMGILLAAVIGVTSQAGVSFTNKYDLERSNLERTVETRKEQDVYSQTIQQHHKDVAAKYDDLRKGIAQRSYWLDFLSQKIADAKPPGVVITNIEMNYDGWVTIKGTCASSRLPADFNKLLVSLVKDPVKGNEPQLAEFDDKHEDPNTREKKVTFTIRFQVGDKFNSLKITPTPAGPARPGN